MRPPVQEERIQRFRDDPSPGRGDYVLYWMQQSQRAEFNHALEFSVAQANQRNQGVVCVFGLMDGYPEATRRHFAFMLEGLKETVSALAARRIPLMIEQGDPAEIALRFAQKASLLVCDRGYLRHQALWRERVAREAPCPVAVVESDAVVPVETVSGKAEYAARTLRPKLRSHLQAFLTPVKPIPLRRPVDATGQSGVDLENIPSVLDRLRIDRRDSTVGAFYRGGTGEAKKRFRRFLKTCLARYSENSNQPQTDDISRMSPYLHFGQISPVYLALEVRNVSGVPDECRDAFLEELIVRRELAINYVHFTPRYDRYDAMPGWARTTLADHVSNVRPAIYTTAELVRAQTHDPYWNAAMCEMKHTGFMHNYMRMYWGKKVLEWSPSPRAAFTSLLEMNNRYFLDGRDPNSYAGVGWIFGLHDRAWPPRHVFGKVRSMTAAGLERKCNIHAYVKKIDSLNPTRP